LKFAILHLPAGLFEAAGGKLKRRPTQYTLPWALSAFPPAMHKASVWRGNTQHLPFLDCTLPLPSSRVWRNVATLRKKELFLKKAGFSPCKTNATHRAQGRRGANHGGPGANRRGSNDSCAGEIRRFSPRRHSHGASARGRPSVQSFSAAGRSTWRHVFDRLDARAGDGGFQGAVGGCRSTERMKATRAGAFRAFEGRRFGRGRLVQRGLCNRTERHSVVDTQEHTTEIINL
jgi:hypothetical protein